MLNDEQILLKTQKLLENFNIFEPKTSNLYEFDEKLLREIDESELEAIQDVLDDLDGEDIGLNNLFDGKMRIVIDFPVKNTESELGKFVDLLENTLDVQIDWERGMASAQRTFDNHMVATDSLIATLGFGEEPKNSKITKKFEMKIGKYLAKVDDLLKKYKDFRIKVAKFHNDWADPDLVVNERFSVGDIEKALGENYNRYNQLLNQLELYIGRFNPSNELYLNGAQQEIWKDKEELRRKIQDKGDIEHGREPRKRKPIVVPGTSLAVWGKYWLENSKYIRDNLESLNSDEYSIIITRHPIDVLRMSDFNNITSCHSPPSRSGGESYYKCAVAEAMGHGALAYVVKTEELLTETNTSNIQSAEQEIQEDELFSDDVRGSHIGLDLSPVSRVRIRQVKYYNPDDNDGTDIGMVEKRIYGASIPGFSERVTSWARQSQENELNNLPMKDGKIDLDNFIIFGGSYEDTAHADGRQTLMMRLLNLPAGAFVGAMEQNTDTEDELDLNAISGIRGQFETEIENIVEEWNSHYAAVEMEASLEDDFDGGFFISAEFRIVLEWELDEWEKLPNPIAGEWGAESINDIYGGILLRDSGWVHRDGTKIRWGAKINTEHPDASVNGVSWWNEPYDLNETCKKIDVTYDDRREAFKSLLETHFKREGYMAGGEYMQLAVDIENDELTSYEWALETDGEYEDSWESGASFSFDYDPDHFGMSLQVMDQILNSRDYRIQLRRNLLNPAQTEVETEYFLPMNLRVNEVAGEARVVVTFTINADEPSEMVKLFRELVEGDMDDEDNLTVVFNKTLAQLKASMNSGVWPEEDSPATANLSETLVKNWRSFLS